MSLTALHASDPRQLWHTVLDELQLQTPPATYDTWLRPTCGIAMEGGQLVVEVPNSYTKEWLEHRLAPSITETTTRTLGEALDIVYRVRPSRSEALPDAPLFDHASASDDGRPSTAPVLNPRYRFDSFVVGSGSRLAHAAAQAVAEHPADRYNPLFVYGGVGLGKTHLLHAIGHACIDRGGQVILVSSEKFTNDLIDAIRRRSTDAFRAHYRAADVLLIDDIHFIAGKESTQEEFFHTFNHLHEAAGQIVLTSDRPPQAIATLEDRLRSRFQWGLQVDIEPPDLETRIAILRHKVEQQRHSVPDDVVELIAQAVQNNVRELEGALNRVMAYVQVNRLPMTDETAKQALADLMIRRDPPTLPRVLTTVADYFDLSEDDLTGRSRAARISEPRQVAMFLMREEVDASYPAIGRVLGGRDHTTILHGCDKVSRLVEQDPKLRRDVMSIRERLYA